MRITDESINHNAVRLIEELTECMYEADEKERQTMLGEIRGVIELAKALKEVLNA